MKSVKRERPNEVLPDAKRRKISEQIYILLIQWYLHEMSGAGGTAQAVTFLFLPKSSKIVSSLVGCQYIEKLKGKPVLFPDLEPSESKYTYVSNEKFEFTESELWPLLKFNALLLDKIDAESYGDFELKIKKTKRSEEEILGWLKDGEFVISDGDVYMLWEFLTT